MYINVPSYRTYLRIRTSILVQTTSKTRRLTDRDCTAAVLNDVKLGDGNGDGAKRRELRSGMWTLSMRLRAWRLRMTMTNIANAEASRHMSLSLMRVT